MAWFEANFDGLVGATHNYAGLSYGNVASAKNKGLIANPREGALQGLAKMQHMRDLGMVQGILPPHDRPHLSTLRALGFSGSDAEILTTAWMANPALVANLSSSATMWTANAATVTPSPDTTDGRTHFTPANLSAMYHRSIEHETTGRVLQAIFPEGDRFTHHAAIPGGHHMGDEGAANHTRFCGEYGDEGVGLFVYGRGAFEKADDLTFPGRQTMESSHAVGTGHGLRPGRMLVVRQNPEAINMGAFHNDVVAVGNRNVHFYHEKAFENPAALNAALQKAVGDVEMHFVEVPDAAVPLKDAISSYLFNSQLISVPGRDGMTLILPVEVAETVSTKRYVDELLASGGPITHADYMDVRQSMRNGGGPACLRLRVAMSDEDKAALGANCILTDTLVATLEDWVKKHYRDRVAREDLGDVALMEENFRALDELTQILQLGSVYDFQR
ncbi:N-succinylarginine dihydrolase [Kordiimonas sediminis]|uniref:N-succinylarginine dihydrolase n=1 Tax=Kordiimonas sediminis TaxID=1735581 RepID=A0A919AQJ8_9PROT|nr:N-succinylarginine dihydrolase [Kordiimonas sediminis]GHF18705.1 N-succinylarginine dihydrolase [Kordiimonas sediminis]